MSQVSVLIIKGQHKGKVAKVLREKIEWGEALLLLAIEDIQIYNGSFSWFDSSFVQY